MIRIALFLLAAAYLFLFSAILSGNGDLGIIACCFAVPGFILAILAMKDDEPVTYGPDGKI
ncbi:MAG: hypothetical protein KGI54_13740 [Pseudomonadota bacterium]|nr:hypothetical protein [Pseudomonadota bacterium]